MSIKPQHLAAAGARALGYPDIPAPGTFEAHMSTEVARDVVRILGPLIEAEALTAAAHEFTASSPAHREIREHLSRLAHRARRRAEQALHPAHGHHPSTH